MRENNCFTKANLKRFINQLSNLQWQTTPLLPSSLIPENSLQVVEHLELNGDWAGDVEENPLLYEFVGGGSMEELLSPVILWLMFAAFIW